MLLLSSLLTDEQRDLIQLIFKEDRPLFQRVAWSVVRSDSVAQDVVSDAMIRIMEKIEKISSLPRPQMRSYCVILVKNIAYDHIRAEQKAGIRVELTEDDAVAPATPEQMVLEEEQKQLIASALDALTRDEQALVYLRYDEKLGYREIAGRLGITEETAKKRGQRVLEKLRRSYDNGNL